MKQIVSNYTYSPTANCVTLTGLNIDQDQLLLVVAPGVGRTLYNFASITGSVVAGTNTRINLTASTAGLTTTSPLVIYYDDQATAQAISGTVTANVPLYDYDIQYIRCNFNITRTDSANIYGNIYLRKIGDYIYESIRYQGGEDEAYVTIYLWEGDGSTQKYWRFTANGAYSDLTGVLAFAFPQDAGSFGSPLPPKSGWSFDPNYSGSISITYEQPQLNNIQGTVTIGSLPAISGTVTASIANSITVGSLPVQLSTTTIGGTSRLNVTLSSATTVGATAPSYGNLSGGSDGTNFRAILTDTSGRTVVTGSVGISGTVPVSGTFYQATQPVSGTVTATIASTTVTVSAMPSGTLTTRFGTPTTANTAFLTSAVTNTARKYLLIQNVTTGSNVITVGVGFVPTTTQGIQLAAGAGITFESSYIPTGAVWVLSSVTASNHTILEA